MKKLILFIGAIFIILVGVLIYLTKNIDSKKSQDVIDQNNDLVDSNGIVGCYVMTYNQDVYTMDIKMYEGEIVTGLLHFNNYQKDSSKGDFIGTYKDEIILADYSFQSEGMNSVMQVAFKKFGDDFVRGYGPLSEDGTKFTDVSLIEFDPLQLLSLFKLSECLN